MRYKVKMTETIEYVIEGNNEQEVMDWMQDNTIREVRKINSSINVVYDEQIIEKTLFPSDITTDDFCEDIIDDDWDNRDTSWLEEEGN